VEDRRAVRRFSTSSFALGSYTCYMPGQFTTIAGLEGLPVGNVFFAGEHANSFYDWQGFMEGAALSGVNAAAAILQLVHTMSHTGASRSIGGAITELPVSS
jgi:monoamine oxidase